MTLAFFNTFRAELDSESSLSSDSVMLRKGVLILSLRSEDSARRAGARASRACAGGGAAAQALGKYSKLSRQ